MLRKIRTLWLLITFGTLVVIPGLIGEYVREQSNPSLHQDPLTIAQNQWAARNYDGALAVYDYMIANDLDGCEAAEASRSALLDIRYSWSTSIKSGVSGYVTGNVEDGASLVGCVLADLTVVGDVRDLAKQTYRKLTGGEVDQFNAALAAAGLAVTVAPEIGAGIAVCKEMMKFMGTVLKAHVIKLIEIARETKNADRLIELARSMGKGFERVGTGMFDMVRGAKDAEELKTLLKIIDLGGQKVYAVLLLGGRSAQTFIETAVDVGTSLTGPAGKQILKFGLHYPQVGIRIMKLSKKLGWDHLDVTLAFTCDVLARIPLTYTVLIGLAAWLWLYWLEFLALLTSCLWPEVPTVKPA